MILCFFLLVGCTQETSSDGKEDVIVVSETEEKAEKKGEAESEKESEQLDSKDQEEKVDSAKRKSEKKSDDSRLGDYEVYLGGEMVETEGKIVINGTSNLLPGARVVGEVFALDEEPVADTTEIVQEDGTFYMEIPHQSLNEKTTVTVKFDFDGQQDDAIKRHYGDRGQKLKGKYVYQLKGKTGGGEPQNIFKTAKVDTTFEPSEEMAIRQFNEPSWYPVPEDMGDPRVWIEISEITNDENYFYLHGKSNLLEGSVLEGNYHYKNARTSVKPDGSFDMKFEYEYNEDATFKVTFDPSSMHQWNIIEETYGAKGQKLVGNLVVQKQLFDDLVIVKEEKHQSTEIKVPDNVELKIEGTEVMMLIPDNLLFDFDQYQLKEESKNLLKEISQTLTTFDQEMNIEISGHTDNVGDEQYNMELSQKRADEVKNFLAGQGDFSTITFVTKGYGMTKPIASNDTESGQAKNRRVEITIDVKR